MTLRTGTLLKFMANVKRVVCFAGWMTSIRR